MSDIDAIRKRLAECSIPVGMQPVIRAEQLYELLECAARYPEDVAALLARIDEMQRENDRLRLRIEGMKGHERFDDHIQKVELSRLEELLSHLGSWRSTQGHCYDLTNPEAEVQPIIDRIDEQAAEIERIKEHRISLVRSAQKEADTKTAQIKVLQAELHVLRDRIFQLKAELAILKPSDSTATGGTRCSLT